MSDDIAADVAIAGAGAAGLMTALRASENPDLLVVLLEKSIREGSNAAISSGSLAAGGTRFQAAAGVEDSPQRHAADLLAASGDSRHTSLVEAVTAVAPTYVEWLVDGLEYPLEIGIDMTRKGQTVPRLHADPERRGGGPLIAHLRSVLVERPNVALLDQAPVTGLQVAQGRVVGVTARQGRHDLRITAPATVLATDGFAGNRALMREYCAPLGEPFHGGVAGATGDAIPWLRDLDVELRNMGACLRHGQVTMRGTRVNPNLPWLGAVLLNDDGARFVDEQAYGYSGLASQVQAQPSERATMIWDDEAHTTARHSEMMRESDEAGAIGRAADVIALAEGLRIAPRRLAEALRARAGRRQLQAPFYYARVTHGVLTTQGGAAITSRGEVVRRDGSLVPGLFAAGGTAVGLAGERSEGYSSGAGLLAAFGMGWIIGNGLAHRSD